MKPPELIVIGCSLGGMHALKVILQALPHDFQTPVAIAQHRHKASNEALPSFLRRGSGLCVVDVDDKLHIKPNCVYMAPADYHLLVERGIFHLSVDMAVAHSRPSIDVLFESAADAYGDRVVAVVLTGANSDGTIGAKRIKERGGMVVVQDPATAESPVMPRAVVDAVRVDRILPLDKIGPFLVELARNSLTIAGRQ